MKMDKDPCDSCEKHPQGCDSCAFIGPIGAANSRPVDDMVIRQDEPKTMKRRMLEAYLRKKQAITCEHGKWWGFCEFNCKRPPIF